MQTARKNFDEQITQKSVPCYQQHLNVWSAWRITSTSV